MEIVLALGLLLLVVMVVGHCLWLAVAWFFRALFTDEPMTRRGGKCPTCGAPQAAPYSNSNGHVAAQKTASSTVRRDELQIANRQVARLCADGQLSAEQCEPILAAINAEIAELMPQPKAPPVQTSRSPLVATTAVAPLLAASAAESIVAEIVDDRAAPADVATPSPAKTIHPLDRPIVPTPPRAPVKPGRTLADMLQSFMEESNIRWGEILAAALIVLCSVGLVVSLRNTLKNIPYFPAILFTLFTVAFHSAGLYTLRRWKLQAVSRVILIISLLLVPLTFCGSIVLQQARTTTDPLFLIAIVIGAAVFGWVTYTASRELAPSQAFPLALGVLLPSMSQVLIQRLKLADGDLWQLHAAAAIPVAGFLIATLSAYKTRQNQSRLTKPQIRELLRVLATALFALLVPLALILVRRPSPAQIVAHLSPELSLSAAAALGIGLLIHLKTKSRQMAGWQAAGTAIVVLGAVLLLLLVAATWPDPGLLLIVGLMNCVSLAALGRLGQIPLLYVPSVLCAALAATIGWHLTAGHFTDRSELALHVVQAAARGQTSLVLIAVGGIAAGLAAWCLKVGRRDDGQMLLVSAGAVATLSFLIAVFSGFVVVPNWPQDAELAAATLLVYSGGLLAAGRLLQRNELTACASFVFWLSLVQGLAMNPAIRGWLPADSLLQTRPILTATLMHGVLTSLAALIAVARSVTATAIVFQREQAQPRQQSIAEPLAISAAVSLASATPFILWVRDGNFVTAACLALAGAVGWALITTSQRWQWAVSGLQVMLSASLALAVAGRSHATIDTTNWLIAGDHLLMQCAAAALATTVWAMLRRITYSREALRQLLNAPWSAVDQILLAAASIGVPLIALFGALPSIGWELGLSGREIAAIVAPAQSFGLPNAWFALAIVCGALAVSLWERVTFAACAGLPIASLAAIWLLAEVFAPDIAAASAARWAAAGYAVCWAMAFLARDAIAALAQRIPALRWSSFPRDAASWFGAQPLVFGGSTILIITILAVQQQLGGNGWNGPLLGTVFARLGTNISYVTPLIALVGVLLAYAVREKHAGFALGGAAVWQLAANLGFLIATAGMPNGDLRLIQWLQWNALAAGSYSLVWLILSRWMARPEVNDAERRAADTMWSIPLLVASVASAILAGWAAVAISCWPASPPFVLSQLGSWPSYLSVALVLVAIVSRWPLGRDLNVTVNAAAGVAATFVPLIAASLSQLNPSNQWVAYHALETGWLLVGAFCCGFLCWPLPRKTLPAMGQAPHHLSIAAITACATLLAIAGNGRDPAQPWWSLGVIVAAVVIAAALSLNRRNQLYAYASTALCGVAAAMFWYSPTIEPILAFVFGGRVAAVGFECVILTLLLACGFWLWREIEWQRQSDQSFDERWPLPRVHAFTVVCAMPIYFVYRAGDAIFATWLSQELAAPTVSAVTVAVLGGLAIALLWDRRARFAIPLAYAWLGVMWLLLISLMSPWLRAWLPAPWRYVAEALPVPFIAAMALQVAVSGHIWSYGANLAAWGEKLGISNPIDGLTRTARWLPAMNSILTAFVCLADCLLVLTIGHDQFPFRVAAALGPAIAAWGIACLAQESRRQPLQLTSLLLAGLTAVLLAWAQIEPDHTAGVWLTRVLRLLMVLAALTFAYGFVLPRLLFTTGDWNAATRKAGYLAAAATMATFAFVLALEATLFVPGIGVTISGVQVAAVATILFVFIAGLISLAVLPGRDPLLLSDRGRQAYVYAAELALVLVFAHLYLCRPYWFDGLLRPYWPFIVMGLAFAGIGAAELCQRFGIRVLAEPLTKTGSLLPLLPAIGWRVIASDVDYSLVLATAGMLYVTVSYTKQSWLAGIAAAVAGNAALLAFWSESEWAFLAYPQLWLIPPALSVLVAAQLNRRRLPPDVLAIIRYAASLVIYVSSTSEIMTRGFAVGLWPPMILLALAVAGALAGIALRVRAFLILGSSFTLVALLAMIRHATQSIDHNWPWWVFGITLGVAILFLFGLFEKKRADVVLLIGRLRQWEY